VLRDNSLQYCSLEPGNPCEGWAVAAESDPSVDMSFNDCSGASFTNLTSLTINTFVDENGAYPVTNFSREATSVVGKGDLVVTHAFAPSLLLGPKWFKAEVTLANNGSRTLRGIRYRRAAGKYATDVLVRLAFLLPFLTQYDVLYLPGWYSLSINACTQIGTFHLLLSMCWYLVLGGACLYSNQSPIAVKTSALSKSLPTL